MLLVLLRALCVLLAIKTQRFLGIDAYAFPLAAERVVGLEGVIVYTIPLLAETNSKLDFDRIVTVSCDENVRIDRLVTLRGMNKEEAMQRIAAQATDAEREARADTVIDSNCPMDELLAKADEVFASFS